MRLRIVVIAWAVVLVMASPVLAQDVTPEPPSVEALQTAVAEAQAAAATAVDKAQDAERYAEDARNFLGLFEVFTGMITVVGAALGILGVARLFSAQNELAKARERVETELAAVRERFEEQMSNRENDLTALREQLLGSVERQRQISAQMTLALALLPVGERQYKAQDLQGAADTYKRALALDEDNPLIHDRLGYVCVQSGQLEEAEREMTRALEIDPQFVLATAARGYVYRRMGEKLPAGLERDQMMNRSEAHLLEALKQSPRLVDEDGESWWGSLGGLYRRREQIEQAIYAYEQAAKVTPHSSYPFSNLALLYTQKHDRAKMLKTYEQVERLAAGETIAELDNFWGYADLLTSRLALGKITEAEDALRYVFDLMPQDSPYALNVLVDTLARLAEALDETGAAQVREYAERIKAGK